MVSPSARPTVRPLVAAFTLIELLTVVAIIGILAAITFGVAKGVNERAAINQARAELSALGTALEGYKRAYGDYPQTGAITGATPPMAANATNIPGHLFNALAGKIGPKLTAYNGKAFAQLDSFSLLAPTTLPTPTGGAVANAFVDPWGRPYIYSYRTTATNGGGWLAPSYLFFSAGPDGRFNAPQSNGTINRDHTDNVDNIYAN